MRHALISRVVGLLTTTQQGSTAWPCILRTVKSLIALTALAAATVIAVVACGSGSATTVDPNADGGNTPDGGNTAPDAAPVDTVPGGTSLKIVAPLSVTLATGRTKDLLITRAGESAHSVALTVTGLPAGVTAKDGLIAPMQATGTITLVADATAVPNATPVTVTIKAQTSAISATTTFPLVVIGAPGSLDQSWGTKGLTAGLIAIGSQITGVGLQKNGTVVAGGYVNDELVVARYTTSGVLDATFGTNGQTRTSPAAQTGRLATPSKIVVQSTDAIVMACQYKVGGPISSPIRFTAAGAPDTTLGAGGFGAGRGNGPVHAVAVDPAGNILMAGTGFVVRQSSVGVSDGTFNNSIGVFDLGANGSAQALALQSGGRIIAAGINTGTPGGTLYGITATGASDPGFAGGAGMVGGANAHDWLAVALDKTDTIFVAGQESATKFLVGKVTKDGVVDNSWNGNGVVAIALGDVGASSKANDVVVQPDGKVIAVGSGANSGRSVMVVVRFLATGALDTSFGADGTGIVLLPVAAATADANAVVLQADGKILVGGHGDQDWAIARFWP